MGKILLLGGTGLVGSRVLDLLGDQFEIIAPSSSELDLVGVGNFEKYATVQGLDQVTVINCVGFTNVDAAEEEDGDESGLCFRLNAGVVGEIAVWCKENNSRFIHISSDYVFDGEKDDSAYTEEDQPNPLGWYGKTKLFGDEYVVEAGGRYVILRISMPYGKLFEKKKDLANILLERLRNQQPIQAIADAKVSPLFIDDFVTVLKNVLEKQDVVGLYHIAPRDSMTLEQFVRVIAKQAELDDSIVSTISFDDYWKEKYANGSAHRPKNSWMDSSKISRELMIDLGTIESQVGSWLKLS